MKSSPIPKIAPFAEEDIDLLNRVVGSAELINLDSSQSEKETIHLELGVDGAAPSYKPGDALDPHAENDPEYVDELLGAAGPASDDALRADLLKSRDTAPTASIRA